MIANMLYPVFIMAASFGAGIGLGWYLWRRQSDSGTRQDDAGGHMPFDRVPHFLDEQERMLFTALGYAAGAGTVILTKVRLVDLLTLPRGGNRRAFYINLARSRRVDFVVVDAKKMYPVAVIILEGQRGLANTEEDQAFCEKALQAARIPVVRVQARDAQNPAGLKDRITGAVTAVLDSHT